MPPGSNRQVLVSTSPDSKAIRNPQGLPKLAISPVKVSTSPDSKAIRNQEAESAAYRRQLYVSTSPDSKAIRNCALERSCTVRGLKGKCAHPPPKARSATRPSPSNSLKPSAPQGSAQLHGGMWLLSDSGGCALRPPPPAGRRRNGGPSRCRGPAGPVQPPVPDENQARWLLGVPPAGSGRGWPPPPTPGR